MSGYPLFVVFVIVMAIIFFLCCSWIRSLDLERASPIPDITSDSYQETPTDTASSSRIPGQQPSQQSVRVNLPPEIILAPSQHIINQKCDRPPSYESLFSLHKME